MKKKKTEQKTEPRRQWRGPKINPQKAAAELENPQTLPGEWKTTRPPEDKRILVELKPSGFILFAKRKAALIYPLLYPGRTYGLEAVRAWRVPDEPL